MMRGFTFLPTMSIANAGAICLLFRSAAYLARGASISGMPVFFTLTMRSLAFANLLSSLPLRSSATESASSFLSVSRCAGYTTSVLYLFAIIPASIFRASNSSCVAVGPMRNLMRLSGSLKLATSAHAPLFAAEEMAE